MWKGGGPQGPFGRVLGKDGPLGGNVEKVPGGELLPRTGIPPYGAWPSAPIGDLANQRRPRDPARLKSTASRDTIKNLVDAHDRLSTANTKVFQSVAGRGLYLSVDRPDIQFAVHEAMRGMAAPGVLEMARAKRMVRYLNLKGRPRATWIFQILREGFDRLRVGSDADWAGDDESRRSVHGVMEFIGNARTGRWHLINSALAQQQVRAISSGESELYGLGHAAAFAINTKEILKELSIYLPLELETDSAAGKGIASRLGPGRVRHIQTRFLWLQDQVEQGVLTLKKVAGEGLEPDILTKPTVKAVFERLLAKLPFRFGSRSPASHAAGIRAVILSYLCRTGEAAMTTAVEEAGRTGAASKVTLNAGFTEIHVVVL